MGSRQEELLTIVSALSGTKQKLPDCQVIGRRDTPVTKRIYEVPVLIELGSFQRVTGLLRRHGNDRLILSKN
jgi:hypothetical protein